MLVFFLLLIAVFLCVLIKDRLIKGDLGSQPTRTAPSVQSPGSSYDASSTAPSVLQRLQYERARPLFSAAERSFFGVLEQAVGPDLRIMGKVRLADLVQPCSTLRGPHHAAAFNRISRKHVDFVLCDPQTLAAVMVIELDDRSHLRADRRERDLLVDSVLWEAGVPILHVPCRQAYSVHEIREQIRQRILAMSRRAPSQPFRQVA